MAVSTLKAVFSCGIQQLWDTVTSLTDYGWRSDLGRIEMLDGGRFIEYTKSGYPTTFTITAFEPCRRYEFRMENSGIQGRWTGIFTQAGEQTRIEFNEAVTAKNPLMRPFLKLYLKKQQARYARDLKRALDRRQGGTV